jgi:hypothetical protein
MVLLLKSLVFWFLRSGLTSVIFIPVSLLSFGGIKGKLLIKPAEMGVLID